MKTFNEFDDKGRRIIKRFELFLDEIRYDFGIKFKSPGHDIARRFLNEIIEFKPVKEVKDNVD